MGEAPIQSSLPLNKNSNYWSHTRMLSPNPIDLTTIAWVKEYSGSSQPPNPPSTASDDITQFAITAFSRYVLNRSGYDTLNSVVTCSETYDGSGSDKQFTRNAPIRALRSVTINNLAQAISTGFQNAGCFIGGGGKYVAIRNGSGSGFVFNFRGPSGLFTKGLQNVVISYDAGYPPLTAVNEIATITAQTIALENSPWTADGGIKYYPSLVPLVGVANSPGVGQYAVSNGLYVFNSADNARQVAVTYNYNSAPEDLAYAATQAVAINLRRRQFIDLASKSLSAGGGSGTTSFRNWALPPEVERTLLLYTRTAVV